MKTYFIKVKTRAREEHVEIIDESHVVVSVTQPPADGKANEAVIRALAKHFDIAPSRVTIVSGHKNRQKIVDIV